MLLYPGVDSFVFLSHWFCLQGWLANNWCLRRQFGFLTKHQEAMLVCSRCSNVCMEEQLEHCVSFIKFYPTVIHHFEQLQSANNFTVYNSKWIKVSAVQFHQRHFLTKDYPGGVVNILPVREKKTKGNFCEMRKCLFLFSVTTFCHFFAHWLEPAIQHWGRPKA